MPAASDPPSPPTGSPAADEAMAGATTDRPGEHSSEWSLKDFLAQLQRHKLLILVTMGLVTLATTLHVSRITPLYVADTKILIGVPSTNVVDIEEVLETGHRWNAALVLSEAKILTSRTLAAKVVDRLGLVDNPAFNPALRPRRPSLLAAINPIKWITARIPESWRGILPGTDSATAAPEAPPAPEEAERQAEIVARNILQGAVSARIEGRSRVVSVTVRLRDPKLAAEVANTLSELYLLEQLEAKFEATQRASTWLNDRVADLRQQVDDSERAVEEYRQQHGLAQYRNTTVTEQQISEINTQLILAGARTAEAEARLRQARSLGRSERGVESAAEVLASPLIRSLREREIEVTRRTAEMATEYGPRHPKMINIRSELQDLRAQIEAEVEKVLHGLRNELEVAQTRQRTLARDLEKLEEESAQISTAQGRLRVLEREAAANRALFDTFLTRWKETGQQDGIQRADARIISHADVPRRPASPKKRLIIVIALAGSAVLAVALVLLVEHLDRGFRSSEQIERWTGAGTLGMVPLLTRLRLKASPPHVYVLRKPTSSYAESLRTLHTGLLLSNVEAPPAVVMFTSALPGEGKTTTSISMARLLASGGRKVLLIDADLRRSQVARALGLSNRRGLVDLLAARHLAQEPQTTQEVVETQEPLENAIQQDGHSDLHVLTSGSTTPPSPPDLLGSDHMEALIAALRRIYDLIVIDTSPVLMVSDARVLARLADKTVFLIRWAHTRRETATQALRQLRESGADLAGTVLSMVDIRKNARYHYGDSGYYYGSGRTYRRYYAD